MSPQRALQLLTIAFLVLGAVSISSGIATDDLLPAQLREWQEESIPEMSLSVMIAFGILVVACLLSVLVGSVALLRMKRWGAWLHISSTLVAIIAISFLGPVIQHPVAYSVDSLSMLVAGALYGVAFFSDALTPKKGAIQSLQRNAGSRPSSGDSPASETPSSLGPRG